MKSSELETMRKSFNTVKNRSDSIKDSHSSKRLIKLVQEVKKYSIEHKNELFDEICESFRRNDIDVKFAKTSLRAGYCRISSLAFSDGIHHHPDKKQRNPYY